MGGWWVVGGGWVLKMKLKLLKLSTKFKLKLKLKFGNIQQFALKNIFRAKFHITMQEHRYLISSFLIINFGQNFIFQAKERRNL